MLESWYRKTPAAGNKATLDLSLVLGPHMGQQLTVIEHINGGDNRGTSYKITSEALAFLGGIADVHVTSVAPGAIRGNHFHSRRREVIMVVHASEWTLHWDEGENTPTHRRQFSGLGAETILVEPGTSHAVQNTGTNVLSVIGFSPEPYDPSETIPRVLTESA
jgi:dTDP-4-dehydrorhamnose 3,5-epimerase-like enzyme